MLSFVSTLSFPSPVFGGGVGVIRRRRGKAAPAALPISDHDLKYLTSRLRLSPFVADYRATSPEDGGGEV
jgi:hypothetical protein